MWYMISMAILGYLALRWFDDAAEAETRLRDYEERERQHQRPRETIDGGPLHLPKDFDI
jgi:hypothetical protein